VLPPIAPTAPDRQQRQLDGVLALRGAHAIPRFTGEGPARLDNFPLLVRFADARRPETATIVDPDDLQASFGPGVALRRILVERTEDPVSHTIRSRLPWLQDAPPTGAVDPTFEGSPAARAVALGRNHFERSF
jgi:hypothetical protein